jgi:nuclear pore complex protein Nup62
VAAAATPVPSDIRNLNLDDVMNKWSEEIDDLSQQFSAAAAMVSKWDRSIVANERAIAGLWKETQSCSVAHTELSSNLDTILSQQRDLHHMLDTLEREMDDVDRKYPTAAATGNGTSVAADHEREAMHSLASEVMGSLDAMALQIRDLVIDLNKSGASEGSNDVVGQVVAVLNAHLDSLQYLDESAGQLQKRLAEVSRATQSVSRDTRSAYQARRQVEYY